MENNGEEVVITFFSHYEAVKARRCLGEGTLSPVPRSLSSSCGTALFVSSATFYSNHDFVYDKAYTMKEGKWSVLQV